MVFSTNLNPEDLADATFLRRIQSKVYIEPVDAYSFNEIWRRVLNQRRIPYDPAIADLVRTLILTDGRKELRACYPNDICNILVAISEYEKRGIQMTQDDLERAVALYFTHSHQKNTSDMGW